MAVNAEAMFPPLSAFRFPSEDATDDPLRASYDGPSDTMYLDFFGKGRPAASIPIEHGDRDFFYVRVDPSSSEIVGVQIEDFLAYAVEVEPWLLPILAFADIQAVDDNVADELRQRGIRSAEERRNSKALLAEFARLIA